MMCDKAWQNELATFTRYMILVLSLEIFLITIYSMWVLGGLEAVHGRKVMLAVCFFCILNAIICATGLLSYSNLKWNFMLMPSMILIIGLGLDDTYILCMDYQQQYVWMRWLHENEPTKFPEELFPVEQRIGNIMAVGGFSIFVTSFTDFVVFMIAFATTGLGVLQSFCAICAFGVLVCFFFQTTLFLAFLTWDARRQDKGKIDCCCFLSPVKNVDKMICSNKTVNPYERGLSSDLWGKYFPKYALTKCGVTTILMTCLFFTAFCTMGCFKLTPNWDLTGNYIKGEELHEIMSDWLESVPFAMRCELITIADSFTSHKTVIDEIISSLTDRDDITQVAGWYPSYLDYLNETGTPFPSDDLILANSLTDWVGDNTTYGPYYDFYLAFSDDNSNMYASRLEFAQTVTKWSYRWTVDMFHEMHDLLSSYDADGLRIYRYSQFSSFFVSNDSVIDETLFTLYIGMPIIVFIVYCVVWHVQATIYVLAMVIVTDIQVLGMCHWLDIDFDFFCGVCILLALGLTVDFNVHIVHRALEIVPKDSIQNHFRRNREHMSRVMYAVGGSIFHGAFSTFLVVFPLALYSPVLTMQKLFQKLALIVGLGMFQGLFVLPCILVILPLSRHEAKDVEIESSSEETYDSADDIQIEDTVNDFDVDELKQYKIKLDQDLKRMDKQFFETKQEHEKELEVQKKEMKMLRGAVE